MKSIFILFYSPLSAQWSFSFQMVKHKNIQSHSLILMSSLPYHHNHALTHSLAHLHTHTHTYARMFNLANRTLTYTHRHTHTFILPYIHFAHTHTHTHALTLPHSHAHAHANAHSHTHSRTHTSIHSSLHSLCSHTHMHSLFHTHMHTHMHTHTLSFLEINVTESSICSFSSQGNLDNLNFENVVWGNRSTLSFTFSFKFEGFQIPTDFIGWRRRIGKTIFRSKFEFRVPELESKDPSLRN